MKSDLATQFHRLLVTNRHWALSPVNCLLRAPPSTTTPSVRSLASWQRQQSSLSQSLTPQQFGKLGSALPKSEPHCGCGKQLPSYKDYIARGFSSGPDITVKESGPQSESAEETSPGPAAESMLYLRHGDSSNVAVVDVDLGLARRLADSSLLRHELQQRGLEACVDLDQLITNFKNVTEMHREQESIERERVNVADAIKALTKKHKGSPDFENRKNELVSRGRNLRKQLKLLHVDLWDREADVMLSALSLPAPLCPITPEEDEVLEETGSLPEGNAVTSHAELNRTHTYFMPSAGSVWGAVYLHGAAARLELGAAGAVSAVLRQAGLTQFSCPDFTKAVVLEGCGEDFTDAAQTLTLQQRPADLIEPGSDKWDLLLGLCGGSSLPATASFLCKMNVARSSLPLRWFSLGRRYTPVTPASGTRLLRATQATQVSVFGAGATRADADELYADYVRLLWGMYATLGVPVRRVRVGARGLARSQCGATRIEAWLPSEKRYVKVAGVGVYGDFVSRRLMAKWAEDVEDVYSREYLHMVYGTALDVPRLLAVLMESGPFPPKSLFGANCS